MMRIKIVHFNDTLSSPSTVIQHKTLAIHVRESTAASSRSRKTSWQTLNILLVMTLFMLLISGHTTEAGENEPNEVWGMLVQNWCEKATHAKDEGELQAIEFYLANSQGKYIKDLKQVYEIWQQARSMLEQHKAKVQALMGQVSAERKMLDEVRRIPTPKEKELEAALDGVRREIMELSGLMRKVHDQNSAFEASQRAGSVGSYDDHSLEELQAQLGRARAEVASFEREHGDILTLNQQLANFANELESERLNAKVPNASRLKDLESQLDEAAIELGADITDVKRLHAEVKTKIANNLGMEEMLKWIRICIEGRRQQLAQRAKPPQTDLTPLTPCGDRQGPFGCTGMFKGGSFKMSCHNLEDNTNTTREGEASFYFAPHGMVDVLFSKDGHGQGGLGAGKITPQGSVEVENFVSGSELASWKGQFTLQPMDDSNVGPVGKGTLKLVYHLGDNPPYCICEGEFSLPGKKE